MHYKLDQKNVYQMLYGCWIINSLDTGISCICLKWSDLSHYDLSYRMNQESPTKAYMITR